MIIERLTPDPAAMARIEDIFEAAIKLNREALRGVLQGDESYHVLREPGGEIIGVYILRDEALPFFMSIKPTGAKYRGRGAHGVLLALDPGQGAIEAAKQR